MANGNDVDEVLRRSFERLQLKTQSHMDAWGLGSTERCDVDLDLGLIKFSGPRVLVTAPMQVVGVFDPRDGFWLWGWANPSAPPELTKDSMRERDFGDRFGLGRYTTSEIRCTVDEAWRITGLACELAEASGAYRLPMGDAFLFMTFHQVTIHQAE